MLASGSFGLGGKYFYDGLTSTALPAMVFDVKTTSAARLRTGDSLRVPRLARTGRLASLRANRTGGGCSNGLIRNRLRSSRVGGRVKYRRRMPRGESGFTLQTLIVTAVVVVLAIGVGLLFLALTSSSSEDLEDAGRRGDDAPCGPNEVWDAVYYTRGIGGPSGQKGVTSKSVGCKPYCATWEFVAELPEDGGDEYIQGSLAMIAASGIGGPDGAGGVFSSKIGCFAPCYWEVGTPVQAELRPRELIGVFSETENTDYGLEDTGRGWLIIGESAPENSGTRLRYYNDNRAPEAGVIRLGVTYSRTQTATELMAQSSGAGDGKPFYYINPTAQGTPLEPSQIAAGVPTVHEPNWLSPRNNILASLPASEWGRFSTYWEDEDWEIRADPENEVCEIVYTPTDRLICSSDNNSCWESNNNLDDCPQNIAGRPHFLATYSLCRIP